MNTINMPGFSADKSLYKSRSYRTGTLEFPLVISSSVMPAIGNFGFGVGAGGNRLRLNETSCEECRTWDCKDLPCNPPHPNCTYRECQKECKPVPCRAS